MNIRTMIKSFAVLTATTMLACGAQATDYYWIGGESTEWANGNNWSLSAGGTAASAYPGASDTATFSSAAEIRTSTSISVLTLTLAANVRVQFSSTSSYPNLELGDYAADTTSTLALSNIVLLAMADGSDLSVGGQIEIMAGTKNGLYSNSSNKSTAVNLNVTANIIGSGDVYFRTGSDKTRKGVTLSGDNSGFSGVAHVLMSGDSDMLGKTGGATSFKWNTAVSGSANATWIVSRKDASNCSLGFTTGTISFGEILGGAMKQMNGGKATIELGGLDTDFDANLTVNRGSNGNSINITKVGTGTMVYTNAIYAGSPNGGVLTLKGGSTVIASTTNPNSIVFDGGALSLAENDETDPIAKFSDASTAAVIIDDKGVSHTWAGELTVARCPYGFTKRGSGVLTLSTAPSYTGATTVEGGTLALPKSVTLGGALCANGGKIGLYGELSGNEETLFTWTTAGSSVTLDSFDIPIEAPFSLDFETGDTTTSLVVKRQVNAYTWMGTDDNRWENAKNWLVNGEATEFYPGASDNVIIELENQTIAITPSVEFGTFVTLSDTTQFVILFTEKGQTYTIDTEKVAAEKFSVAPPFAGATLSENVYTAGDRVDSTFTWAGKDGATWNDSVNWLIGGKTTGVTPALSDTVEFNAAASVSVDATAYAQDVWLNAAVTFAGEEKLKCGRIIGDGKLTLNGVDIAGLSTVTELVISNDIEVASKTVNTFTTEYNGWASVSFEGNITGAGEIVLDQRKVAGSCGGQFKGDNGAFAGKVTVVNCGSTRDTTAFYSSKATSSNAVYTLVGRSDVKHAQFKVSNETYYLGALNGSVYFDSDSHYLSMTNVTLEIGALGIDCSFGGNLKGYNNGAIRKVGKGVLTNGAKNTGNVEIFDGTYRLGGNIQSGNVTFSGGKMAIDPEIAYNIDYAKKFVNSQSAIIVDDEGADRTWATAIAASNVGGFTKQGTGTLTLSKAPAYTGNTTVEAGVLLIPSGVAFETLTIADGAKLGFIDSLVTAEGVSFTATSIVAPAGQTINDVLVQSPSFAYTVIEEGGVYTVTATRKTGLVYTWTGATDDNWATASNWTIDGQVATDLPLADDAVLFPTTGAPWTNVVLAAEVTVTNLTVEGDTTFSGAKIQTGKVEGDGVITFAGDAGLHTYKYDSATIVVSNDLHIVGSNNGLVCEGYNGKSSWGTYITVYGDITGDGYLYTEGIRSSVGFYGDNTAFAGTMDIRTDGIPRHNGRVMSPCASSSNAVWNVANSGNESFVDESKATYWFGALSGTIYMKKTLSAGAAVTLEIGAREDVDSVLGGYFSRQADRINGEGSYIRKIGASRLDFSGYWTQGMEVNGGVFKIADARNLPAYYITFAGEGGTLAIGNYEATSNVVTVVTEDPYVTATNEVKYIAYADPSTLIKNSTAPIAFDTEGTNVTWATALDASNQRHKIVKKGEGVLTLGKAPAWDALTVEVDAGSVVVPKGGFRYSCGAHTVVAVGDDTLTFTYGDRKAEPCMLFIK